MINLLTKLFNPLKILARRTRFLLFVFLRFLIPKFHPWKNLRIPAGISSIESEELIASSIEVRVPPKTEDESLLHLFHPLEIVKPGGIIALLKNGFSSVHAAHLNEKGEVVPEFTQQFSLPHLYHHPIFSFSPRCIFAKIPHVSGTVASLVVYGQDNYYHWLLDALPKLFLLQRKGLHIDYYYVDVSLPFQKESLHLLGIPTEKILSTREYPLISASILVASNFPCLGGIPKWSCDFLKDAFAKNPLPQFKRLYISRRNARYRCLLNEEEILPLLKENGFEIVHAEHLSFSEQVALFQAAECVIAPHGAGLANLAFCERGTKVLEIFPPRYPFSCYWNLSNVKGLDYFFLCGQNDKKTYSKAGKEFDNILIDPEKLKRLLELYVK